MKTINLTTLGVSDWTLPWSSVAAFGGEVYGLSVDGLERLSGQIEATAEPYLQTGEVELENSWTSLTRAYFKGQIASTMLLTTVGRMQGIEYTQQYAVTGWPWAATQPRTVHLARGVQGSAWSFKLEGSGSAWSIDSFEIAVGQTLRTR